MDSDNAIPNADGCNSEGSNVHYLPFRVNYDGPARVMDYFCDTMLAAEGSSDAGGFVNFFRGIKIYGRKMKLKDGLRGTYATLEPRVPTRASNHFILRISLLRR